MGAGTGDEIEEFLTVAIGDRGWRALLAARDSIVGAELARYGGREVNTTGDGFFGAFDSPTRAVRAGGAIVPETWPVFALEGS